MLKVRPAICLLTFLLLLPGCDHSREENVRHQEISEEETDRAIKEVFAESSGTDAGHHPEGLSRFFENLSSASRSDSALDPDRFLSIDAMAASLKSTDSMKKAPRDFVENLKKALDQQKEKIGGNLQLLGFDDFKVLFVEESPQGGKLVYTRLYARSKTTPFRNAISEDTSRPPSAQKSTGTARPPLLRFGHNLSLP